MPNAGRELDRRRVDVVRALAHVDVVVRVQVRRTRPCARPSSSSARLAITSFAFMLVEVPAPPWITSTTNWSCSAPARISSQAATIASRLRVVEQRRARGWRAPPPA